MQDLVTWFLQGDSPWALMFAFLFVYVLKIFRERETVKDKEIERLQTLLSEDIKKVHTDILIVMDVWKTLIQEELKERNSDNDYKTKG